MPSDDDSVSSDDPIELTKEKVAIEVVRFAQVDSANPTTETSDQAHQLLRRGHWVAF